MFQGVTQEMPLFLTLAASWKIWKMHLKELDNPYGFCVPGQYYITHYIPVYISPLSVFSSCKTPH